MLHVREFSNFVTEMSGNFISSGLWQPCLSCRKEVVYNMFSNERINPLPDKPILGSSNSAANKDMMAEIWTKGDTIICFSRKHCGKRRNCSLQCFQKQSVVDATK